MSPSRKLRPGSASLLAAGGGESRRAPEGPCHGQYGFGSFCRNKRASSYGGETPECPEKGRDAPRDSGTFQNAICKSSAAGPNPGIYQTLASLSTLFVGHPFSPTPHSCSFCRISTPSCPPAPTVKELSPAGSGMNARVIPLLFKEWQRGGRNALPSTCPHRS